MFNKTRSFATFAVLAALGSALLCSPPKAEAANPPYEALLLSSNMCPASTTLTLGTNNLKSFAFQVPRRPTTVVSLGVTVYGTNASTAAQTFTICPSLTGERIDTTHTTVFSVPMSGTTPNTVTTNFLASTWGGCGYVILYQQANAHTGGSWTTVKVRYVEN